MDANILETGLVSRAFLDINVKTFLSACEYVKGLPYGRTTATDDFLSVLQERKGTCSSKHALLALLARECNLPYMLTVGIYRMNEDNTPGVGAVLDQFDMLYVPEAHCYLTYNGVRYDYTRVGGSPIDDFLLEHYIEPEQSGSLKSLIHKAFLMDCFGANRLDDVWSIREACIQALVELEQN
jgi:hypothetical protein